MPPVLSSLRARAVLALGVIAILVLAALWARGNHLSDARDLWRTTAKTQAEATRTASAAAAIRAETARLETERRSAAHARKADHEEPPAVADLRNAADRYADARRLRPEADCRLSGSTDPAASGSPASDRDGRGDNPLEGRASDEVVLVPRQRYDEFVGNTLRLERVRNWGEGLIVDGLAVMDGEEASP